MTHLLFLNLLAKYFIGYPAAKLIFQMALRGTKEVNNINNTNLGTPSAIQTDN